MNPELLSRAQAGDIEARNAIAEELLPSIEIEAKKIAIKRGLDSCDLLSAGFVGLTQAVERFDASNGARFRTYAQHRIRGAMLDQLRAESFVKRKAAQSGLSVVLTDTIGDHPSLTVEPDAPALAEDKEAAIEAIWRMSARERCFTRLYFYHGATLAEIARAFSLSESRVCQVIKSAKDAARHRGPKNSRMPGSGGTKREGVKAPVGGGVCHKKKGVLKGRWQGGAVPYGYRAIERRLFINAGEAVVVKLIFRLYLSGLGQTEVARRLNEDGHRIRSGRRWSRARVWGILKSRPVAGFVNYMGIERKGVHEAIVDEETFFKARRLAESRCPKQFKRRGKRAAK